MDDRVRRLVMRYKYTVEYIAVVITLLLLLNIAEAVVTW